METQKVKTRGFFQPRLGTIPSSPVRVSENFQGDKTTTEADKIKKGFFQTGAGEETGDSALIGLFCYSIAMFAFPIFLYFSTKQILEDSFDMEPPSSTVGPAILAIFSVNIIIMLYVFKAYKEENIKQLNKID